MRALTLLTAALLLPLAACAEQRPAEPAPATALTDRTWTATAIDGAPVQAGGDAPTLVFTADGISGSTGVNSYGGGATIAAGTIAIGALRSTRMAGPPERMDVERAFTRALGQTKTWTITENALILRDADGAERIRAR